VNLTCDVAWINPSTSTHVTVSGTVTQQVELDLSASVVSMLEPEFDPTNNSVTFKLVPPGTPATSGGGTGGSGGQTALKLLSAPKVTGRFAPGNTLRSTVGTWSAAPPKLSFRWQLCKKRGLCVAIEKQTKRQLKVQRSYVGRLVRFVVIATDGQHVVKAFSAYTVVRKH
jgi:hypothetical protein